MRQLTFDGTPPDKVTLTGPADSTEVRDLFGVQQDGVLLKKSAWGVYEMNAVSAFTRGDSLQRAFLSGLAYTDSAVVYLADEGRPLAVSGVNISMFIKDIERLSTINRRLSITIYLIQR